MALVIKKRTSTQQKTSAPKSSTRITTQRTTLGRKPMTTSSSAQDKARISLWNTNSDNEKAPIARGTIQLTLAIVEELAEMLENGEEEFTLGVSLWESDSDNERAPNFTGLLQSPSERQEALSASKSGASKSKKSGGTSKRRRA